MTGAWVLTRKDLRLLLRDRRATVVLIFFPMIFITILGMSTSSRFGQEDSKSIPSDNSQTVTNSAESKNQKTALAEDEHSQKKSTSRSVYQTLVPSFTVLFTFFLVNIMARSFLGEQELGTLRRLRMAPVSSAELLVGKTVPFLIISLIQSATLFLAGKLIYGMSWGSAPWLLVPVIVCTSLAATTLGLLVSTIVKTDSQVSSYANFLVITMAGISGCFLPRNWLPESMQTISLVTPHAWSLIAYEQILKASSPALSTVLNSCAMLILFAALFFFAGQNRFKQLD